MRLLLLLASVVICVEAQNVFISPTETPTESPIPSPTPSLAPTGGPTSRPTTSSPTVNPSREPSEKPSPSPTGIPSSEPSVTPYYPTDVPTPESSESPKPSPSPSNKPSSSVHPSSRPTGVITLAPTRAPTGVPTADSPTESPQPTPTPSIHPTNIPTWLLSSPPTHLPTEFEPTDSPAPTPSPSTTPTGEITPSPTLMLAPTPSNFPTVVVPTNSPLDKPTAVPTQGPTPVSTQGPTPVPTQGPTPVPTQGPTPVPTKGPTTPPIFSPTPNPTEPPSTMRTRSPMPTNAPIKDPTKAQTNAPTRFPTVSMMPTPSVQIDYYNVPRLKWSVQLDRPHSSHLRKGNAVTLSPDNVLLYITHDNGRLTILHAHDGSEERWSYMPNLNENGWTISCQSSVYFGEHPVTGEEFAVYAVTDKSPEGLQEPTSRVIAITHPYHRVMWVSPSFPGTVVGTPVISRSVDTRGLYVFVTHNVLREGHFSVLLTMEDGAVHFTEGAGDKDAVDKLPYAPMTVDPTPWAGKYLGGLGSNNDVMIWTTSSRQGRGTYGYTRAFQVPQNYDPEVGRKMETVRLVTVSWNGIARPTLGSSGFDLFTVSTASMLSGWISGSAFNSNPSWITQLQANTDDQTLPIENAVVLSRDEQRLYSSSTSTIFHAIHTATGREAWKTALASTPMVEAKVTPDDKRVYVIESEDGAVVAMDQLNGDSLYTVTCNVHEANCASRVEAEFDMSDNGLFLYYGDINGNVNAIELGTSLVPTVPPTEYPSFSPRQPSASPKPSPRPTWIDEAFPSESPSAAPTGNPPASPSSHPPSGSTMPSLFPTAPSQMPSFDPTRLPFNFDGIQRPSSVTTRHQLVRSVLTVGLGLLALRW